MTVQTVAEKLSITDMERLYIVGADQDALETIQPLPDGLELTDDVGEADVAIAFGRDREQVELRLGDLEDAMARAHTWLLYGKDTVDATDLVAFEEVAARGGWHVARREPIDTTWEALRIERNLTD